MKKGQNQTKDEVKSSGFQTTLHAKVIVTGSSGFVGARLVEMLFERGASEIVCFDIIPPTHEQKERFEKAASSNILFSKFDESLQKPQKNKNKKIHYCSGLVEGDLTNATSVDRAFSLLGQADIVYHIAALVGPYFTREKYFEVNYVGTLHIIEACRKHNVPRLVYASTPGTRYTGEDIEGLRGEELPFPPKRYMVPYAESKAHAEMEVTKACNPPKFMTVSVAPHQVYGEGDPLFLPNFLEAAKSNRLRIFGEGSNRVSFCYKDNYCHGLFCAADSLQPESPSLGNFYIITDAKEQNFWARINEAVVAVGLQDLRTKYHYPVWFLSLLAHALAGIEYLTGLRMKLTPFTVKMCIIHRYFSLENAMRDLNYEPLYTFDEAWALTIDWFKENYHSKFALSSNKMDIQEEEEMKKLE